MSRDARVYFDHKNNTIMIEPYCKCSKWFNNLIRNSNNLKWVYRLGIYKPIKRYYIYATYTNQIEFNEILDIVDKEFDYWSYDAHDYVDGYFAVKTWFEAWGKK